MERLEEKLRKINKFIDVINEIENETIIILLNEEILEILESIDTEDIIKLDEGQICDNEMYGDIIHFISDTRYMREL